MQVGSIILFSGTTVPERFLVCDGTTYSIGAYPELFDILGNQYGGDGISTFAVPDLSNRCIIGTSQAHALGTTGGSETVVLSETECASHEHIVPAHGHDDNIAFSTPEMAHSVTQPAFTYAKLNRTSTKAVHSSGSARLSTTTNAAMSRATNFGVSDHPATACTMSGGVADCPAFDTENAGQGAAHNNMMPYLALAYIIQAEPDTPPVPSMALIHNGTVIPVTAGGAYIAGRK